MERANTAARMARKSIERIRSAYTRLSAESPVEGFGKVQRALARGFIRLAALRAPKGGVTVQGNFYPGGQFIPKDVVASATEAERKAIREGESKEKVKEQSKAATALPRAKAQRQLGTAHRFNYGGHKFKLLFDSRGNSRGYYARYVDPSGKTTISPRRFPTAAAAAQEALTWVKDSPAPRRPTPESPRPPKAPEPARQSRNYHYAPDELGWAGKGKKGKFEDNFAALQTIRAIQREDREATDEERAIIAKFVGWGQLKELFNDGNSSWFEERSRLRNLIGYDEYQGAKDSVKNSHYTHPDIVKIHWAMAKRLGFKGGKYLEPSVGAGYYLGFMPPEIEARTKTTAIDLDETAAAISKALYPDATVRHQGFQESQLPKDYFDLAATNVPFSPTVIRSDREFKKYRPTVHDYFFLKSISNTKPGGLVMHITSAGTMDKLKKSVRAKIDEDCEFVSAVRFPGGAHSENAGTQVVTDMIILRKKNPTIPATTEETPSEAEPEKPGFTGTTVDSLGRLYHWRDGKRVPGPKFDDTVEVLASDGTVQRINRYFADNPEQILGELSGKGSMYRADAMNVELTDDYLDRVAGAVQRLPKDIMRTEDVQEQAEKVESKPKSELTDRTDLFSGQYVLKDGKVYQYDQGALTPIEVKATVPAMLEIRDAARELNRARLAEEDDTQAKARLNELYDEFVSKHGPLNSVENRKAIVGDADRYFLQALERYDPKTGESAKADMFRVNTVSPAKKAESAKGIEEAVNYSLRETGTIRVPRIAELLGIRVEEAEERLLGGAAFIDPSTNSIESRAIYLSGNVREKLRQARSAAEIDPKFQKNVDALEKSLPEDIPLEDIHVRLGTGWVRPELYERFARHVMGIEGHWSSDSVKVRRVVDAKRGSKLDTGEEGGVYESWDFSIEDKGLRDRERINNLWGVKATEGETYAVNFQDLFKAAMAGKSITVRVRNGDKSDIDKEATEAANGKIEELQEAFSDWIVSNEDVSNEILSTYNENFNNIVPTNYNGDHLDLPGMRTTGWPLRSFQKDFVARVIATGKGLAAHEVGTGKTASMVAAAMELRRLGLAKKPAIACLKANVAQIAAEAQELYPNARILSTDGMFDGDKRRETLQRMATGDYDMIIMSHEHLNFMQLKPETRNKFLQQELAEIEDKLIEAEKRKRGDGKIGNRVVAKLAKARESLQEQIKEALAEDTKDQMYFEDSGIDQIFVDEAHKFKSLPCVTADPVSGIPTRRSQRATSMLARCRYLLENNNGRGVVFATGTPIANTMGELFNLQRYLQYDLLEQRNMHRFDGWRDSFGVVQSKDEFKLSGEIQSTRRFSKFVNLPELRLLTSEFMDIQRADDLFELNPDRTVKTDENGNPIPLIKRPKKNDRIIVSETNDLVDSIRNGIIARTMRVKMGLTDDDNMLTISQDAKKAAIDPRLLDASLPDDPTSKANQAVKQIVRMYQENPGTAQAVFSDIGVHQTNTQNGKFHLFKDVKQKLMAAGIPKSEIVDFSETKYKNSDVKMKAQEAIKQGKIRIVFGSTETLGTGTNIQKKLRAIHHLDIPYVPSVLEQRNGRAHRQGNTNAEVDLFSYVQEGSADNIFWTILANKTAFINQFMKGRSGREMVDVDAERLDPDQMIAIATGDPNAVRKIELKKQVQTLERARTRNKLSRQTMTRRLESLPDKQAAQAEYAEQRRLEQRRVADDNTMRLNMPSWARQTEAPKTLTEFIERVDGYFDRHVYRGLKVSKHDSYLLKVESPIDGKEYVITRSPQSLSRLANEIAAGKYSAQAEEEVQSLAKEAEQIQERLSKPWLKEEELREIKQELAILENHIDKNLESEASGV